jgi:pyrroline-5-carboxylate reductase
MTLDRKLAVIGAGNIGGALIRGLLDAKRFDPQNIRATVHPSLPAKEIGEQLGVVVSADNNAATAQWADVIVLSVKPYQIQEILAEIKEVLRPEQILISLAAAVPIATIERAGSSSIKIFRAMPNLAMTVGTSATAVCANNVTDAEDRTIVENIFETVGRVYTVDEDMMHAVTALSGSGPAYVALFTEALAAGAIKLGLPANLAVELAEQMILGSAKLLLETGKHPSVLRDEVSTPGGTTVAGLEELDRGKVSDALQAAVEAAGARSLELAKEI